VAIFQYQLEYGATYATLNIVATNLQEVSLSFGRREQLDQYSADTASVTLRYPNGYSTPNSYWVTGTWVKISGRIGNSGAFSQLFLGKIADVIVDYGIPYKSSVGNADFVTLQCEGAFAALGRVQGGDYAMPADILGNQTTLASSQSGLSIGVNSSFGSEQLFPATTVSGTWGDWCNRVALTMNGRMIDIGTAIVLVNAFYKLPATFGGFSDTLNNASNHPYEAISFNSLADNWYTQITVDPESYSPATVQTGLKPYRTYLVNTLNNSTGQATDYANYLLSTYQTQSLRTAPVTCNLNAQSGAFPRYGQGYVGTQLSVLFRGVTYQCVIEGGVFSGTPESASATFYLSAQDLNNYLLLNDTVYGRLDFNKLGY